jgi:glutathione-regulated potassium-efflux system ancillary protein KefG
MSKAPRRILLLLAHPSIERSEVNQPMVNAIKDLENVTLVDLYAEYFNFQIDIDVEQQRLLTHDVIIFQYPLYWYSTPAILKEWQDLVLEYGFAYGSKGKALHGKIFLNAVSAGGKEAAYRAEGYNHFTIRELLHPIEQMTALCGMVYLPPFALFGARTAVEEGRVHQHIKDWTRLLVALRDDQVDINAAQKLSKLNIDLANILKEI